MLVHQFSLNTDMTPKELISIRNFYLLIILFRHGFTGLSHPQIIITPYF